MFFMFVYVMLFFDVLLRNHIEQYPQPPQAVVLLELFYKTIPRRVPQLSCGVESRLCKGSLSTIRVRAPLSEPSLGSNLRLT